MLNLTPDIFNYKMFTARKTQITEADLCTALRIYQDFWNKADLKSSIKKVGLTLKVIANLRSYKNPLVSQFSNSNDETDYIILFPSQFDEKYMTAEEYQAICIESLVIFTARSIKHYKQYLLTKKVEMYLNILKRYPRTTQSRILIKYLKQILKKDN